MFRYVFVPGVYHKSAGAATAYAFCQRRRLDMHGTHVPGRHNFCTLHYGPCMRPTCTPVALPVCRSVCSGEGAGMRKAHDSMVGVHVPLTSALLDRAASVRPRMTTPHLLPLRPYFPCWLSLAARRPARPTSSHSGGGGGGRTLHAKQTHMHTSSPCWTQHCRPAQSVVQCYHHDTLGRQSSYVLPLRHTRVLQSTPSSAAAAP